MKSKTLGILIASMASVALMGAGFSSWVVSGTIDSAEASNVTVTVADVVDSRIVMTAGLASEDKLVFDCGGKTSGGVFSVGKDSANEDLTVTVRVTLTAKGEAGKNTDVNVGWNVTLPESVSGLAVWSSVTYNETVKTGAGDYFALSTGATGTATYDLVFAFGWGADFNHQNPVELTSAVITDTLKTDVDAIVTKLGNLKTEMAKTGAVKIDIKAA